ncbi:MAG TPA: VOC family protein [Candidatus Dormibacteraeota bacterium]|nr:VOC family protein [Candidatus Dormibacteraeota bacterium]
MSRSRPARHLAEIVLWVRDMDRARDRCREAGLEVRGGVHPVLQGVRTFYVDDPDGFQILSGSSGPLQLDLTCLRVRHQTGTRWR